MHGRTLPRMWVANKVYLGDRSGRHEVHDAPLEFQTRDLTIAVGVPLPKEGANGVAMLIQGSVPPLHGGNEGALHLKPLVCLP